MPPGRRPRRGTVTRRGRGRNAAAGPHEVPEGSQQAEPDASQPRQIEGFPAEEQGRRGDVQSQADASPVAFTDAVPSATSTPATPLAGDSGDGVTAVASATPARLARGRATIRVQPKNIQRRSKAERDAAAQAEAERLRGRTAAAAAAAEAGPSRGGFRDRDRDRGRGRGRGGGRGGFMGETIASGPFSSGVAIGLKGSYGPARIRIPGASSGDSSGSGLRTKKEPKIKTDSEGDAVMLEIAGVKQEDQHGGYISSDADEAIEGPRMNVENLVNLISSEDEDSDEGGPVQRGKRPAGRPPKPVQNFAPIRVVRREHVDRSMGMGADADLPRPTESKGGESRGSVMDGGASGDVQGSATRKGKARTRDVEFIRDERKWRGVYDEDDEDKQVRIKDEPADEGDEPILVPSEVATSTRDPDHDTAVKEPPPSPDLHKKVKAKGKLSFKEAKPVLQTAHEREEWARRQADLDIIRDELGHIELDADTDLGPEARMKDRKADAVYLFQLPPVLPDLRLASDAVKKELKAENPTDDMTDLDLPRPNEVAMNEPVKIEEDDNALSITRSKNLGPSLASGLAGKLRIHESGRATLSWGGTSLELSMGMSANFLQDVVLTRITPEAQRVTANDGGEAMAFGQVRGKFVVTPDFNELFG